MCLINKQLMKCLINKQCCPGYDSIAWWRRQRITKYDIPTKNVRIRYAICRTPNLKCTVDIRNELFRPISWNTIKLPGYALH